jgi:hypothetical protein
MRCELASQRNMWKTEAFVHYVTLHEEDETLVHVEEGGGMLQLKLTFALLFLLPRPMFCVTSLHLDMKWVTPPPPFHPKTVPAFDPHLELCNIMKAAAENLVDCSG